MVTLLDETIADGQTGHRLVDHPALAQLHNVLRGGQGLESARPLAGASEQGDLWWSTDARRLDRFDGTDWQAVAEDEFTFVQRDFDAVGDATNNDSSAINSAAASIADGGTLIFEPGIYRCDDSLDLASFHSIHLFGIGTGNGDLGSNLPPVILRYTGTGSDPFLDLRSTKGITVTGIAFEATSAAWTGALVDLSHDPDGAGNDASLFRFTDCLFSAHNASAGALLDAAIIGMFINCEFASGFHGVRGAMTSYSNVMTFIGCTFREHSGQAVINVGEAWSFKSCTFEPLSTGAASGITQDPAVDGSKGLSVVGCWFGDAYAGGGTILDLYGTGFNITGNVMGGTPTTTAISFGGDSAAIHISANWFVNFDNVIDCNTADASRPVRGLTVTGNFMNTIAGERFVNYRNGFVIESEISSNWAAPNIVIPNGTLGTEQIGGFHAISMDGSTALAPDVGAFHVERGSGFLGRDLFRADINGTNRWRVNENGHPIQRFVANLVGSELGARDGGFLVDETAGANAQIMFRYCDSALVVHTLVLGGW